MRRAITSRERDEGFTLIELLVVIIIIGILAAIAVPLFLRNRERAVEASMRADVRNVAEMLETYFADNQSYPADLPTLAAALDTSMNPSAGTTVALRTSGAGVAPGTYCLSASNTGAGADVYYDSDRGGLLRRGLVCS